MYQFCSKEKQIFPELQFARETFERTGARKEKMEGPPHCLPTLSSSDMVWPCLWWSHLRLMGPSLSSPWVSRGCPQLATHVLVSLELLLLASSIDL